MARKTGSASAAWQWLILGGAGFCAVGATSIPQQAGGDAPATPIVAPAPVPAPVWTRSAAAELSRAIAASANEGLRPADYDPDALDRAIAAGEGPELDQAARRSALMLAHDYQFGRVGDRADLGWHIDRRGSGALDPVVLEAAAAHGGIRAYLDRLLPTDVRYKALRSALADAPNRAARDRIRANMERWRWMPRDLGGDYIYVNVPSYRLQRIEGDAVASTYTVVVGAKDTPTPWIAGDAPSLVVNPWWNVPQSIVKSANMRPGRGGYVWKAAAGGWSVRQPPGPRNALGRLKINLTNDQAIYLHDTPSKAGFARDERALSHGCIRVKDIDRLAAELMADGDAGDRLDEALAGRDTRTLALPRRWPVYLVYFTMDRDEDGKMVSYGDPYGRDAEVLARLDGRPSRQLLGPTQVAMN